jgi:hypothetical protein
VVPGSGFADAFPYSAALVALKATEPASACWPSIFCTNASAVDTRLSTCAGPLTVERALVLAGEAVFDLSARLVVDPGTDLLLAMKLQKEKMRRDRKQSAVEHVLNGAH